MKSDIPDSKSCRCEKGIRQERSSGRKQMLGRHLLLAASVAAIATMAAVETPDDQLVIAVNMSSMRGMDPHELNQLESAEAVANIYERLITFAPDDLATPQPGLATSWTV